MLSSQEVVAYAWNAAKPTGPGAAVRDLHQVTGRMANSVLHESMTHASLDNLTVIVVTFSNFDLRLKQSVYNPIGQHNGGSANQHTSHYTDSDDRYTPYIKHRMI